MNGWTDRGITRLYIDITYRKERWITSKKRSVSTIQSAFPSEWKANRKVASYLDSMTFPSNMHASPFLFRSAFLFTPSLTILRTPRAILSTNAISATEGKEGKEEGARGSAVLERIPRENSMFFRWRSIITRARTRSISDYFKLLTRHDIPKGGETSPRLSSGKFRTTDRKLIRRARIKTRAECCRR